MLKALVLIIAGLANGLFAFLRPGFYWDDPRLRLIRRLIGEGGAFALLLVCSAASIAGGLYLFNGASNEADLASATILFRSGSVDSAAALARAALKDDPGNAGAWSLLGMIMQEQSHTETADSAYRQAVALDSGLVQPYLGLGILAAGRGRLDEADADFRHAIRNDTGCAEAYSHLSMIDLKRYRDAEGLSFAERAFALANTSPAFAANLAIAYHYNGRTSERDLMRRVAVSRGFPRDSLLAALFDGRLTVRDEHNAPRIP
jgi:Flp pilus assembly protein TadD